MPILPGIAHARAGQERNKLGFFVRHAVVPPKYSDGPAMIGLDRLPFPLLIAAAFAFNVHSVCLGVQDICAVAAGKPLSVIKIHSANRSWVQNQVQKAPAAPK